MQNPHLQPQVPASAPPTRPTSSNRALIAVIWILTLVGAFFIGREELRWELRRTIRDAFSNAFEPDQPGANPFSPLGDDAPERQILSKFDWAELERGIHSDPGEFTRGFWLSAYEHDSEYHHQLVTLLKDNQPEVILAELSRLAELMVSAESPSGPT